MVRGRICRNSKSRLRIYGSQPRLPQLDVGDGFWTVTHKSADSSPRICGRGGETAAGVFSVVSRSLQGEGAAGRVAGTGERHERRIERLHVGRRPQRRRPALVKVNLVSLTMVSGIFGAPPGFSPPRLTADRALLVEEVDHRQGREPGPVDRDQSIPTWLTELTAILRSDRHRHRVALLECRSRRCRRCSPRRSLVRWAVNWAAPLAGSVKLSSDAVRPGSPGLRKNGPTLPPGQAQNRSIATPWRCRSRCRPASPREPCVTTVSTLLVAKLGSLLVAASPLPLMLVMVGMPAGGRALQQREGQVGGQEAACRC